MTAPRPGPQAVETRQLLLGLWLGVVLTVSVLAGMLWYMAPFALGFVGPHGGVERPPALLRFVYFAWIVGLPFFALGQIGAFVLAFWRLRRAAILSTALLAAFLAMIGLVFWLW